MVYNAKSGLKNAFLDSLHKTISPSTYQCALCTLTYGKFLEKPHWKKFRKQSKVKISFYHIDEFEAKFGLHNYIYPVGLWFGNQNFETVISNEAFKTFNSTEELINYVEVIIDKTLNTQITRHYPLKCVS